MPYLGPFFYIDNKLVYDARLLSEARQQYDKLDNPYSHEKLYDDHFRTGDYIDYPRGRVIWDLTNDRAIIYVDPCINTPDILEQITKVFQLDKYVVEGDDHYHCRNCTIWSDI